MVGLDPATGAELRKRRPVVVMNHIGIGRTTLRMIAPILGRQSYHATMLWMIPIDPAPANGLSKLSCIDVSQFRSVDVARFSKRLGTVPIVQMDAIVAVLNLCVG